MDSPCIDICVFEPSTGWCVGCGRTRKECGGWRKAKPFRREAVLNDLPRRLERLSARGLRQKVSHD